MGSADWMPRNLERRVEILFPIEDEELKAQALHILESQLKDNVKAHICRSDGSYVKMERRGREAYSCQDAFCREAKEAAKEVKAAAEGTGRVFIPEMHSAE